MDIEIITIFWQYFVENSTIKIIFSKSKNNQKNITVKPVEIKKNIYWQIESSLGDQTFYSNYLLHDLIEKINTDIIVHFRHITLINIDLTVQFLISYKGKVLVRKEVTKHKTQNLRHNREKKYLLCEGENIEPLRDLGIFNLNNQLVKAKYDKYRQINRFIEIINDKYKNFTNDSIRIIDFGCGKSYLTFLVYYYFKFIKQINTQMIGYDHKFDVINKCNGIAKRYGYNDLQFYYIDLVKDKLDSFKADIVISLHACDIITDYALYYAIINQVPSIFSVPCCQHEIKSQIQSNNIMQLLLKDGLIKERFSALLTDAIRCEILRKVNYAIDVIEFVDFEFSTKNLMIRASLKNTRESLDHLTNDTKNKCWYKEDIQNLTLFFEQLKISPKLFYLLNQ